MTESTLGISTPVGLIAGGGVLPFAIAESLVARQIEPVLFAIKGFCDPTRVGRFRHHWLTLGQLGRVPRLLRSEGCRDLVFIGALTRPSWRQIRPSWETLRLLPSVAAAFRGGDDHLLSGLGRVLEKRGFRLLGIKDVAPDLLMPAGCLTRTSPDGRADADIAMGRGVLQALSPFDIGQAVIVIDGHCVAVEDIEGTDGLLKRVARLREEGRIRTAAKRGVLVKAPKTGQDLRFDLPTLGPRTVELAAVAALGGIAGVAHYTVVAEPQEMIASADKAGLFVVGVPV